MTKIMERSLKIFILIVFLVIPGLECGGPLFISAISSALATIPFTAGPMTMGAGLVGAKLAVGSKLLYYLGFFGRRTKKAKRFAPAAAAAASSFAMKQGGGGGGGGGNLQFPGGMSGLPFPYSMMGGGGGGGGFQTQQFGGFGGSPNMFQAPQEFQAPQGQFGGFDPAQMFQALAAQGIDPMMAMHAMNGGGGGGFNPGGSAPFMGNFPQEAGGGSSGPAHQDFSHSSVPSGGSFTNMPLDLSNTLPPSDNDVVPQEGGQGEDVESFFTFLRDMDDNTCISRLICDIGADPSFLGEFSENIDGIISSLDISPSSGAFQYSAIMETGRREGGCKERFPQCGDTAYEIVKSVAPSVGVPDNINSAALNRL